MAEHTPGPWVITTGADDERIVTSTWNADGLDDDVALVYGGNEADPVIREANARLIAAAPDLLAALEQALTFLYEMETVGFVVDDAEAAIRKARGDD